MSLTPAGVTCPQLILGDSSSHASVENVIYSFEHGFFGGCVFVEGAIVGDDSSSEAGYVSELEFLGEIGVDFDAAYASLDVIDSYCISFIGEKQLQPIMDVGHRQHRNATTTLYSTPQQHKRSE